MQPSAPVGNNSFIVTQLLAEGLGSWDLTSTTNMSLSVLPTWPGGLSLMFGFWDVLGGGIIGLGSPPLRHSRTGLPRGTQHPESHGLAISVDPQLGFLLAGCWG